MNRVIASAILGTLLVAPPILHAQQDESESIIAYATYFVCANAGESRVDEIVQSSFKPHYDQAVEQEQIDSWSWLQHYVGGKWRRVLVVITRDMESALETSGALGEIVSDTTPEAGRAFSEICGSHDDYIWQSIPGIGGGPIKAERGTATFSTYLKCNLANESRADALIRDVFAPIYDKHVKEGELTSWNWLKAEVGGDFRRLLTFGAVDHNALMNARAAINEELTGRKLERAVREMNEVCHARNDYMWDTLLETSRQLSR